MEFIVNLGRTALVIVRQSLDVVRHNISLGILSFALAVTIWFFVIDVENEPRTDFFPAVIPVEAVNVPQGLAVATVFEPVSVRISADEDVWDDLSIDDFQAIVDLSAVKQREASVPVRVTVDRGSIKIVEVDPSRVTVTLESLTSKTVPVSVKLVGAAPLGYSLSESKVSPEYVSVSGPESLVNLVDAAVADVNLTGIRVSLEHTLTLTSRDARGGDINGVNLDPNTADVSLTITKQEFSVLYIVNPSVTGNVAPGYQVTSVEAEPFFATVSGPLEVLQSIDTLTTENVAVDLAQSDVVRSVKLRVPEGARVEGSEEVVVRVRVAPARGESVFTVALHTEGLPPNYTATLMPPTVTVTLAGPLPSLQTLAPDSITATVDLSDFPTGTHRVAPTIQIPAGTDLVKSEPADIVVTISSP